MQVRIIGAGIGGLALANGLRRHGVDVTVHDRDTDLGDTAGYHLHLHARALQALRRLLSPATVEQLYASSADGRVDTTTAMRDHRGHLLRLIRAADTEPSLNIDRVTLRLLLADGPGAAVETGSSYVDSALHADGSVEARFADGSRRRSDVLVGADGVGSRVAQSLAGGPTSSAVGLIGIGGFSSASALPSSITAYLGQNRSTFAVGPRRSALYIGYHDPRHDTPVTAALTREPATGAATYIWGAMIGETASSSALLELEGERLRAETVAQLRARNWAPRLTTVLEHARLTGLAAFRLHAATTDLAPWPAGPICALGDAVHPVPPTGGQGAATAILDADVLCAELVAAHRGEKTIVMAVNDFHTRMRPYARVAVEESLRPVSWINATESPLGRTALRLAPLLSAWPKR